MSHLSLRPGARILDLTCHEGELVEYFTHLGFESMGLDPDLGSIQKGHQLHPELSLYQHDLDNIFYVNYFDLAIAFNPNSFWHDHPSLNHFRIKNALSALKEKSIFLFKSPWARDQELENLSLYFSEDLFRMEKQVVQDLVKGESISLFILYKK